MNNDFDIYTGSSTQNFALINKAVLRIPALKNFELYLSTFQLPGLSAAPVRQSTPHVTTNFVPSKAVFDSLRVSFKVDEDFRNWRTAYAWISGISRTHDYDQYRDRVTDYSDLMLHVFDANNNQTMVIQFTDAFPISLTAIDFAVAVSEPEPIECTIEFAYDLYKILSPQPSDFHRDVEELVE